jgi:hypothetical protein
MHSIWWGEQCFQQLGKCHTIERRNREVDGKKQEAAMAKNHSTQDFVIPEDDLWGWMLDCANRHMHEVPHSGTFSGPRGQAIAKTT